MSAAMDKGNEALHSQSQHKSSPLKDATFEPEKLSEHESLPPSLQKIVDQEDDDESIYEDPWAQKGTESNKSIIRYAAYASRIRTLLYSMQRYAAYTSDISGSLRHPAHATQPPAHANLIRGAYTLSWAYMLGDAAHEGHIARRCNRAVFPERRQYAVRDSDDTDTRVAGISGTPALEDHRTVAMQRLIFHSLASMALPAFTLHHVVKYTNIMMKSVRSKALRAGGPLGISLSVLPFFPYIFDKPVEDAVEWIFYKGFQMVGGQDAVGSALQTGRTKQLHERDAALSSNPG